MACACNHEAVARRVYTRHLMSNSPHPAARQHQELVERGSPAFQPRSQPEDQRHCKVWQVLFAMRPNHRIWVKAGTYWKMSVPESRELVCPFFCPSKLVCCWSDGLPRSLEAGEHPEWLFPSSGEAKGKRRSLRAGQTSGLRQKWG